MLLEHSGGGHGGARAMWRAGVPLSQQIRPAHRVRARGDDRGGRQPRPHAKGCQGAHRPRCQGADQDGEPRHLCPRGRAAEPARALVALRDAGIAAGWGARGADGVAAEHRAEHLRRVDEAGVGSGAGHCRCVWGADGAGEVLGGGKSRLSPDPHRVAVRVGSIRPPPGRGRSHVVCRRGAAAALRVQGGAGGGARGGHRAGPCRPEACGLLGDPGASRCRTHRRGLGALQRNGQPGGAHRQALNGHASELSRGGGRWSSGRRACNPCGPRPSQRSKAYTQGGTGQTMSAFGGALGLCARMDAL
mmetsp:Transcript_45828/g.146163  ORF Transcript_45828/g.146163 Transcript_45828/m.146163 type:complete len:304 (+) Transcript_45828:1179-2090(+)